MFSKNGHSALLQPSEMEGRTKVEVVQQGNSLKVEGSAGNDPSNDALVVEVSSTSIAHSD